MGAAKMRRLIVVTTPSTLTSSPLRTAPAAKEKNLSSPGVHVPLFGKKLASKTPIIVSSGWRRSRKSTRLNAIQSKL